MIKFLQKLKKEPRRQTIFIPIGRGCHSAMHLDLFHIRTCSYPLDWLIPPYFSCSIETKFNLIINGFKNFLNKEDLVDITTTQIQHKAIYNKYTNLVYYHDFTPDKTIDEQFDEINKKYSRRIKRLLKHIQRAQNICFIYMLDTWDQKHGTQIAPISDELWKSLIYRCQCKYKNKNFQLLIFTHDEKYEKYAYDEKHITENITRFVSNHNFTQNNEPLGITLSIEKIFKDKNFIS